MSDPNPSESKCLTLQIQSSYPRYKDEDFEHPLRQVIMQCIQEKRRRTKRAGRKAANTLPPAKRGRPCKPNGIRDRLRTERAELNKKLGRLRREGGRKDHSDGHDAEEDEKDKEEDEEEDGDDEDEDEL
jgi:hypothetical protein